MRPILPHKTVLWGQSYPIRQVSPPILGTNQGHKQRSPQCTHNKNRIPILFSKDINPKHLLKSCHNLSHNMFLCYSLKSFYVYLNPLSILANDLDQLPRWAKCAKYLKISFYISSQSHTWTPQTIHIRKLFIFFTFVPKYSIFTNQSHLGTKYE